MDCCSGQRHCAGFDRTGIGGGRQIRRVFRVVGGGRQVRSVVRIAAGGGHFYVCMVGGESGFLHIRYIIFDRVILD